MMKPMTEKAKKIYPTTVILGANALTDIPPERIFEIFKVGKEQKKNDHNDFGALGKHTFINLI
jgi:hypothetical protein